MKKKILTCAVILALCMAPVSAWAIDAYFYLVLYNDTIASDVREEIGALDEKVLRAIEAADASGIADDLGEAFTSSVEDATSLFSSVQPLYGGVAEDFVMVHVRFFGKLSGSVAMQPPGRNFTLNVSQFASRNVLSLKVLKGTGKCDLMLATVYALEDDAWKIERMSIGTYANDGLTAPDLYASGRAHMDKGEYFGAFADSSLAVMFLNPAGGLLTYDDESGISTLYQECNAYFTDHLQDAPFETPYGTYALYSIGAYHALEEMRPYVSFLSDAPLTGADKENMPAFAQAAQDEMRKRFPDYPGGYDAVEYVLVDGTNESDYISCTVQTSETGETL